MIPQSSELQFPKSLCQVIPAKFSYLEFLRISFNGYKLIDCHQFSAQEGIFVGSLEILFELLFLYLFHMIEDILKRSKFLDKMNSGLFPHTGDTGDVIRAISGQSHDVDKFFRLKPIGLFQSLVISDRVLHRVQHGCVGRDELSEILVAGYHHHRMALFFTCPCQRADDIISLVSLLLNHLDTKIFYNGLCYGDLCGHILRHRGAIGLILGIDLMSEGGTPDIKDDGEIPWLLVCNKLQDHLGEAKDEVCGETL